MLAPNTIEPTPERRARGPLTRETHAIADDRGNPSHPWRAVDTLAAMLRHGTITAQMAQAGDDFRTLFRKAHLDPLRAADMTRARVDCPPGRIAVDTSSGAYRSLRKMLDQLGPLAGSCLWDVIGLEYSLKQWAIEHQRHEKSAAGILVAALDTLAAVYYPQQSGV